VRRLALGLIAATAAAWAVPGRASDLAGLPPAEIAGFATWPFVAGEVRKDGLSFAYRFHVNPQRPALYSVMRYRVLTALGEAPITEKFLWAESPGSGAPLRCFELGLGESAVWREMAPGTTEYKREMMTLMAVLGGQSRDARERARAEP